MKSRKGVALLLAALLTAAVLTGCGNSSVDTAANSKLIGSVISADPSGSSVAEIIDAMKELDAAGIRNASAEDTSSGKVLRITDTNGRSFTITLTDENEFVSIEEDQ